MTKLDLDCSPNGMEKPFIKIICNKKVRKRVKIGTKIPFCE